MPEPRTVAALFVAPALLVLTAGSARAEPQGTAGLTIGAAGVGMEREFWSDTVFHLGLRGDVLFAREANDDFGIGPYAELLTHAFDEVQVGAGASVLLPVLDTLPIVLSGGVYGRAGEGAVGFEPGVAGTLFWGSRSYNYHSSYVMSGGILAELRVGLGASRETAIVIGAQLDLAILTMPAVLLINAAGGESPEAAPVR